MASASEHPRYPQGMRHAKKAAAKEAFFKGNHEEAARLFTEAHLAELFTHCVVLPADVDDRHFCALTASWYPDLGTEFLWFIRVNRRCYGNAEDSQVFQFQTGKCGQHQHFAFKIVAHGGVEDEGVDSN